MSKKPTTRRGRPPKAEEDKFSVSVYVRMTAEEKAELEKAAAELGITKWARDVLLRAARRANK